MTAVGFFSAVVIVAVVVGFLAFLYYFAGDVDPHDRGRSSTVDRRDRSHAADGDSTERHRDEPRARTQGRPGVDRRRDAVALFGGRPLEKVTLAMIAAQRAQIPLEWQRAAAIDLAGRDVPKRSRRRSLPGSSRRRSSRASRRTASSST